LATEPARKERDRVSGYNKQVATEVYPPTWVLWTYATEWEIVTADAVDIPSKVPVNLSYFETAADCTAVRSWMAGLAKGPAVSSLNISFQCFPSNIDPRSKK